jgi:hypothetical protein
MSRDHVPVDRADLSDNIKMALWRAFDSSPPATPRLVVSGAAIRLALEHHSSITSLIRLTHFASAAALMRPLLEATATSVWSLYVATDHQIEGLVFRENVRLPSLDVMVQKIAKNKTLKGKVEFLELIRKSRGIFDKFTHGCVEQLKRRYSPTGTTFDLQENILTLFIADMLLLLAASVEAARASANLNELVRLNVETVVSRMKEEHSVGPLIEWKGWDPLPPFEDRSSAQASHSPINSGNAPEETK